VLVFCVSNNVMPGFGLFNHIVFMWLKSVYGDGFSFRFAFLKKLEID